MDLDELATRAGQAAKDIGSGAERPPLTYVRRRRRRSATVAGLSLAVVLSALVVSTATLWPRETQAPIAADTAGPSVTTSTMTALAPVVMTRDDCPVTGGDGARFTPASETPEGPPASYDAVWHGSPELWTMIYRDDEAWAILPEAPDGSLTQKTFWWMSDLTTISGPIPDITVTLESWDDESAASVVSNDTTTGGHPDIGIFAIVGVQVPTVGCWKVTASYKDSTLSYVVWVGEG